MSDLTRFTKVHKFMLISLIVLFFAIPYMPVSVLAVTDLVLVRLTLLLLLIAAAYIHPLIAIVVFVLVAFLFIERNKTKVHQLKNVMSQSTPDSEAIASIVTPDTAPRQPAFEQPKMSSLHFMPENESGENTFRPVAPSLNEKHPLPTESADGSDKAIHQLFEWVNPNLAQAP